MGQVKVVFLFFSLFFCPGVVMAPGSFFNKPAPKKRFWLENIYITKLIHTESRGRKWVVSRSGARGMFQIHWTGLKYINNLYGTSFSIREMHEYSKAYLIYKRLQLAHWRILEKRGMACVVTLTNAYNMGVNRTMRGTFNSTYLNDICPNAWEKYQKRHNWYRYKTRDGVFAKKL